MTAPHSHHHTQVTGRTHGPAPRRPRADPPRSLLGVGIGARLSFAALATGLLWLTVLWALN
ncbi:MAG TPA: hypothetical protein PL024_06945 [Thauera sp.]|nr:hypothetical protein [Thauera sp.]HRA81223.1 hypothetical protein [Thauera sp.]